MVRKKERQKHHIEKGMSIEHSEGESKKKGEKRIMKSKMPARIKKTPRIRQK